MLRAVRCICPHEILANSYDSLSGLRAAATARKRGAPLAHCQRANWAIHVSTGGSRLIGRQCLPRLTDLPFSNERFIHLPPFVSACALRRRRASSRSGNRANQLQSHSGGGFMANRSEERRVGKERRSRWSPY